MRFPETAFGTAKEQLIPLSQVPDLPFIPRRRRGRKLSKSAVYRWAKNGVGPNKVRLATTQCGGTKCTTVSKLLEFFRHLGNAEEQGDRRDDPGRRSTIRQVEVKLENEGF